MNNYRWVLLIALSFIAFIINVDYTAVNLALIPMAADLHASLNTIQWVLSAYGLAWAVLVIPAGSYADKYLKKYVCSIGLVLFFIGSVIAGFSSSASVLILSRVLQGVAGAIYVPTLYALIFINFAEEERGKAMGLVSLGVGLGMAMGPFIGGVLLSYAGWRSIFFVNIPICLAALAIIFMSKDKEELQAVKTEISKSSVFLLSMFTIVVLYLLNESQLWSQYPIACLSAVSIAIVGLIAFVILQKKLKNPLVPLNLFANRGYLGCCVGIILEQCAFSIIMVGSGFYLQKVMQFSSLKSSVIYLFLTSVFGVIAVASGPWIDKVGLRLPTVLGASIIVIASLLFAQLTETTALWMVCFVFVIIGVGMGLAFAGLNTGVVKTVSQEQVGIGSSVFLMFALIGNSFGVAFTAMIYEKASLAKLVKSVGDLGQEQVQQLANYIANIGSQNLDLSAFSQTGQAVILNQTTKALSYGINQTMLVNFVVCLTAVFFCAKLLKTKPVKVEDEKTD